MALTDPTQTRTTNFSFDENTYVAGSEPWNKQLDGYQIPSESTEATTYQADFPKWHGLYRKIPELRSTIDTEARWIVSKEIKLLNKAAKDASKRIKGKGKETFRIVLLNMKRTSMVGGDSYSWAPRDKAGRLINLKILDPGSIQIQADKFGIIKNYAQLADKGHGSLIPGKGPKVLDNFKPEEIFHLSNDPIADEIHGIPEPEKLQDLIKMRHLALSDSSVILHKYGKPTYFYEADTDDETELAAITDKIDKAFTEFKNIVTPKGTLTKIDRISVPQYGTIDAQPWHNFLRSYFTESSNVPDLVRGKSDEVSLAAGKLNILSFKEKIIMKQMEYEEQIEAQLGLKLEFERPVEIDIEISRTEEDMAMKASAKRGKGGELQTDKKLPGTGAKK